MLRGPRGHLPRGRADIEGRECSGMFWNVPEVLPQEVGSMTARSSQGPGRKESSFSDRAIQGAVF